MGMKKKMLLLCTFIMLSLHVGSAVFGAPTAVTVQDAGFEAVETDSALFGEGYVEIDIGEKEAATNVRYAEIDGVQTEIVEKNNKYSVAFDNSNMLVEITEKTSADALTVVKTQYFYIDAETKTAKKLNMDSYMQTYEEKAIRTVGEMGIRFKAHALTEAKLEETEYIIDEYGYIIAIESALNGEDLTFSSSKYITGIGFNRAEEYDIVFDSTNDDYDIFTLVIKNIPVEHYGTNLVCKTYTKLRVHGKQFVVYSEPMTGNVFDVAAEVFKKDATNKDIAKIVFDYVLHTGDDSSFADSFVSASIEDTEVTVSGSFTNTDSVGEEYNVYLVTYNRYGTLKAVKKSESFTVVSGTNTIGANFTLEDDEKQAYAIVLTSDLRLVAVDKKINWQITEDSFYDVLGSDAFTSSTDFSQYFDPNDNVTVIEAITLLSHLHAKYNNTEVKEREEVTYETILEMDDPEVFVDLSDRNSVNLTGINLSRATGGIDETNGYLYGQSDVSDGRQDPQVVINGLNLDARKYNKITLRMKLEEIEGGTPSLGSKSFQLFFKTNSVTGIDETKSFLYSYRNVSNVLDWFEVELDLTDSSCWKNSSTGDYWEDVITGIRFDPLNGNAKFYIDYIKFSQGDSTDAPDWYDVYLDYAIDNNIVSLGEYFASEFDREVTREEFFLMLISAFPESEFEIVNNISAIPDLDKNEKYAELYLLMYNSGITLGFDEDGNLGLSSPISRSQFAGIANRLLVPANRLQGTVNASWDSEEYKYDIEFNDASDGDVFTIRSGKTESATVVDGSLVLVSKAPADGSQNADSGMVTEKLIIDADKYNKIKVRMKADYVQEPETDGLRQMEIYFKTDDFNGSITDYHYILTVTDNYLDPLGWYVFELDMATHQEWNGTVNYFRFDPMNAHGTYTIDYIRFIKSPYVDLPDHESLVNAGYVATDLMPDGFKNGFLVTAVDQSIDWEGLQSRKFAFPESTGEPLWNIGPFWQGADESSRIDLWESRDTTADEYTLTDIYGINTITYNPELDSMTQRLNATKIYNGEPHNNNEYEWWPHQLFDTNQNFTNSVDTEANSADADRIFVELDIRMLDFQNTTLSGHSTENMNVCSYLAYFYLRVKEQPSHKIWFGFNLFGTNGNSNLSASKNVKPSWGPDSAAHQYMYGIPTAVVYDGIENSFNPSAGVADVGEEWKKIRLDITPHIDRAIEWANRDNIFGMEVTKSDMFFNGVNIGYEIHGNYDATFEIKNLRMVAYNKD